MTAWQWVIDLFHRRGSMAAPPLDPQPEPPWEPHRNERTMRDAIAAHAARATEAGMTSGSSPPA